MVQQLSEKGRRWVEIAARHADDFATRAAQHDLEGSFPLENFEAMKASGYTNMPIPEEMGGGGRVASGHIYGSGAAGPG